MLKIFNYFSIVILSVSVFWGCATMDNTIHKSKATSQSAGHSINKSVDNIANSVGDIEADIYESSFIKFFADDKTILENREKYFIKWNKSSRTSSKNIINKYIKANKLKINFNKITISQKMNIINQYYFNDFEKKHIQKFKIDYKKFKEDEFLTDRENIEKLNEYNLALVESEHQWDMGLHKTKKKVASLMLSSLYSTPKLKFDSYDPYKEEIYLSIFSTKNGFKERFKFKVVKDIARKIKKNITHVKPSVYFKIAKNNALEFVGVSASHKGKHYLCEIVDIAYIKQNEVQFTYNNINLAKEKITYSDVIKNITPPDWYRNEIVKNRFYGQGESKDKAKADAYNNYALSVKVTVNSSILLEDESSGSLYSSSIKSKSNQKVNNVSVEGARIVKSEKKDGIWFFAIEI